MSSNRCRTVALCSGLVAILAFSIGRPADYSVGFQPGKGQLHITIGGNDFAAYVFSHPAVTRPFFASVRSPSGIQATRNFPPVQGVDDLDHDTMHPGIWHSFGDLGGRDYWRNKCSVEHERFASAPRGGPGRGTFTVRNYYKDESGNRSILEVCAYTIVARPGFTLIIQDSTFSSDREDFYFGDQEELGLGIRVNTGIAERHGGAITNADGVRGAKQCWGRASAWIDYSGIVDGTIIGVMIMPDPENFRPSWYHARDYGFIAANPFGRKSMNHGESDRTWVRKGEKFRYRNGVAIYSAPGSQRVDKEAIYVVYLEAIGGHR